MYKCSGAAVILKNKVTIGLKCQNTKITIAAWVSTSPRLPQTVTDGLRRPAGVLHLSWDNRQLFLGLVAGSLGLPEVACYKSWAVVDGYRLNLGPVWDWS